VLDWQKPDTWLILIIDDEPDNLELVTVYLQYVGAVVKTASNGLKGLETLSTFHPNLILLDLSMPKMDGWDVIARVREDTVHKDVVTIALTAHAMIGDKERVKAAGFDGYLAKPLNLPTFTIDLQNAVNAFANPQESNHAAQ